jgi:DNA-binding NtrC family response regulator
VSEPLRLLTLAPAAGARALSEAATAEGFVLVRATSLGDLLGRLQAESWSCTLLSLAVEPVDEAVAGRVADAVNAGALLLSAPGASFADALLGQRVGAVALVREPFDTEEIAGRLREIGDEGPDVALPSLEGDEARHALIGRSAAMVRVFDTAARAAGSTTTVLLTGESGTGKEVVARALHDASRRAQGPFVPLNCAAIPEQLLESELFGHEKGAFTGATARRRGRFERAHSGTLFLDEIGDMSLVLQAKLLRVLEEGLVEPLGGESATNVDVRVVAATNLNLAEAMASGRFREDLYYRLAVIEIGLPPLRERGDDVRLLALHFAAVFARRQGGTIRAISRRALDRLVSYAWPGNVRELRNVVERAVMLGRDDVITSSALRLGAGAPNVGPRGGAPYAPEDPVTATLAAVQARHIARVLHSVDGHQVKAAAVLGIHRNTLARKLRDYHIDVPQGSSA